MNDIENLVKQYFDVDGQTIFNHDGSVKIIGGVSLVIGITKLPVKFSEVTSYATFTKHDLTTLEGSPERVGDDFSCVGNNLSNLEGGPKIVKGSYDCFANPLTSFKGIPDTVEGEFWCDWIENVPMLSLLKYDKVSVIAPDTAITNIFIKYAGQKPLRQAIIKCQKELIDLGYEGNARL